MKLITRDTDYALRAICYIARNKNRVVDCREMADKLKIPRSFLRKILQALNREGILSSQKGKNGGFCLALSAGQIFLMDLIRIFQGELKLNECFLGKERCPNEKKCALRRIILSLEARMIGELKKININSLLV